MNILIDIGHPAHVHMFRCFAHEMINRGHKVLFTTRDKEFEIALLEAEKLPYVNLGKKKTGKLGRIWFTLQCEWKVLQIAREFQADIFLSHGSLVAAHVAWLMRKPAISFEDTFNMEQVRLYMPFVSWVLTSDYEHPLHSPKVLKYPGYHELLYLHPKRFTPQSREEVAKMLGITPNERYAILRFVGWHATHDTRHNGFTMENKRLAVQEISKYVRVFISSEDELPEDLKQYKLPTKPEMIDDVMAHATLVFGESPTMDTEAAVLGTLGIVNNVKLFYTEDMQKYGLSYCYRSFFEDQIFAINKAVEILSQDLDLLGKEMQLRRQKMLSEKIDCTAWLCWFVENYPHSVEETKNANATGNTEFWKRFK